MYISSLKLAEFSRRGNRFCSHGYSIRSPKTTLLGSNTTLKLQHPSERVLKRSSDIDTTWMMHLTRCETRETRCVLPNPRVRRNSSYIFNDHISLIYWLVSRGFLNTQQTQKAGCFFLAWNPQEESPAVMWGISSPSPKNSRNPGVVSKKWLWQENLLSTPPIDAGGNLAWTRRYFFPFKRPEEIWQE